MPRRYVPGRTGARREGPVRPDHEVTFPRFVGTWNRQQGRSTPRLHLEIAFWLEASRKKSLTRLLLMVFRNAGKSTLVGLYCAWLLTRDPNLRILVLSAESQLAQKMTRDVRQIIEQHLLARHLWPRGDEPWAADQLTVRRRLAQRDPSILARGITGNITGSRADVIVCDDVEVPNTAGTPEKRLALRDRLRETGFVLVPGGTPIFVGTPHTYFSIYAAETRPGQGETEPFLADYARKVIPLVDAEGRSAWPERFTPETIEKLKRESGPARFRSQMLLEPTHIHDLRLDPAQLVPYAAALELRYGNGEMVLTIDGVRMVGASCWWDPSVGRPDRGDASVIAAVFTDAEGGYWLHAVRYLKSDRRQAEQIDEATQLCRAVVQFVDEFHQPSVTIETNGIGQFLPAMLRRELAAAGRAVGVREATSTRRKDDRILDAFDPLLAARALRVHADVWRTPFIAELREWLPGGKGRDDGLDAVSGCILSQPVRLGRPLPPGTRVDWRPGGGSFAARSEFPV